MQDYKLNQEFYRSYTMILLCEDSVNTESIAIFKEKFEKNLHQYDTKASVESINFNSNMKCAYNIEGKNFVNIIILKIKLLHTDNLGKVLSNLRRKYHRNNQTIRNMILNEKNNIDISNIDSLRKQVESSIY